MGVSNVGAAGVGASTVGTAGVDASNVGAAGVGAAGVDASGVDAAGGGAAGAGLSVVDVSSINLAGFGTTAGLVRLLELLSSVLCSGHSVYMYVSVHISCFRGSKGRQPLAFCRPEMSFSESVVCELEYGDRVCEHDGDRECVQCMCVCALLVLPWKQGPTATGVLWTRDVFQ